MSAWELNAAWMTDTTVALVAEKRGLSARVARRLRNVDHARYVAAALTAGAAAMTREEWSASAVRLALVW